MKAALSIMPSMPMFTTPDRSFMIPHSAPSAIGAASPTKIGAITGRRVDQVADELEDDADDRDRRERLAISSIRASPAAIRAGDRLQVHDAARGPDPEEAADDDVRGEEEQDHGLDDVDDLDRDLGLDLHQPGAGAQGPEEERGERRSRTGATAPAGRRRWRRNRSTCRTTGS